jgi:hypothetical protein
VVSEARILNLILNQFLQVITTVERKIRIEMVTKLSAEEILDIRKGVNMNV